MDGREAMAYRGHCERTSSSASCLQCGAKLGSSVVSTGGTQGLYTEVGVGVGALG